ncbi:hypothetical protein [Sphingomonas abietis]|uniref:Uncharacterized protein n=1 Tax=Sphingomonas abietis TaxID=3012344 RepID=A0ABY7NJF2_9SPHN|nr:hypothetical protein [Sphingomonas abietis]WBO21110.1 hypothetical protein PBT88_12965 [Sphingomonas abietis]
MVGSVLSDISLLAIKQQMLGILGRLDHYGEHIAAAHLVAALDALDDRLEARLGEQRPASTEDRPLDHFARAMIDRFGDRAEAVARAQLVAASGDAMLAWATIIGHLEALVA